MASSAQSLPSPNEVMSFKTTSHLRRSRESSKHCEPTSPSKERMEPLRVPDEEHARADDEVAQACEIPTRTEVHASEEDKADEAREGQGCPAVLEKQEEAEVVVGIRQTSTSIEFVCRVGTEVYIDDEESTGRDVD